MRLFTSLDVVENVRANKFIARLIKKQPLYFESKYGTIVDKSEFMLRRPIALPALQMAKHNLDAVVVIVFLFL